METLLIYTEQSSNRLIYILDLIVTDLMGIPYELTHQKEYFKAFNGPKFSYATEKLGNELHFQSGSLLFETEIKFQIIQFVEWNELVGFFPVYADSALPFDVFATAFFMASRYEEYLPSIKDKHNRYRASQSLNFKAGILEKPVINYYAIELQHLLLEHFPNLSFQKKPFRYTATFDIDIAYSYKAKGVKRTIGGLMRSVLFSRFREFKDRILVLSRGKQDPYDTYDYLFQVCAEYSIPTIFFFLLADESRFDKNISHTQSLYRSLIKQIDEKSKTGIHLSYKSHIASKIMRNEIDRLVHITGKEVCRNRFHYLRFKLPNDLQRLIKLGITEDYSMGYAAHVGFRAGLCTPFYFFNLATNDTTILKIFPFAFMDTTFTHYAHSDNDFALDKIQQLMKSVRETGGEFMGLWHNNSFIEMDEWKGWRKIFETVARQAAIIANEE